MKTSFYLVIGCVAIVSFTGCQSRNSSDRYQARTGSNPPAASVPPDSGVVPDHTHPPGTPADHDHPGDHTQAEDTTPIPSTLPAIWSEVETHRQELERVIVAGSLDQVHAHAVRISRLVAALAPLSGQYVSTRQGPLTDAIHRVEQISDLMHDAADAGDAEGTRNQKQRLDSVLDYIHGLYPAGVLAAS
jgi:hypothetical protein